jgi:transcriptional regulator with XRE-family HTH domain
MEKNIRYWHSLSDPAILGLLGKFIQEIRLQQNKTQLQVATAAGINRSTVVQIENGGKGSMISYVQILRALEQLQIFEHFEVKQQISPLQLAKLEQNKRKRASAKKEDQIKKPTSVW